MKRKEKLRLVMLLLTLCLACSPASFFPTPTPTATPTLIPTPPPLPTATPLPADTGWQPASSGVTVRSLSVETGIGPERVTVVRIDPATARFRVHYTPGVAQLVSMWAQQTGALLTVNAGYFTEEKQVTGLTISDGIAYGTAYGEFAGLLAVSPDGEVRLRWMREAPYIPGEPLAEGVQSFPLLVKPGGIMGFPSDADDGSPARRLVVAQDFVGRILFLVAPRGMFSLHALAVWLTESDLEIDIALNLDGGPSAGLWLAGSPIPAQVDSHGGVPAVITVEQR